MRSWQANGSRQYQQRRRCPADQVRTARRDPATKTAMAMPGSAASQVWYAWAITLAACPGGGRAAGRSWFRHGGAPSAGGAAGVVAAVVSGEPARVGEPDPAE